MSALWLSKSDKMVGRGVTNVINASNVEVCLPFAERMSAEATASYGLNGGSFGNRP